MRVSRLHTSGGRIIKSIIHEETEQYYLVQVMEIINPYPSDWRPNDKIKLSKSLVLKEEER